MKNRMRGKKTAEKLRVRVAAVWRAHVFWPTAARTAQRRGPPARDESLFTLQFHSSLAAEFTSLPTHTRSHTHTYVHTIVSAALHPRDTGSLGVALRRPIHFVLCASAAVTGHGGHHRERRPRGTRHVQAAARGELCGDAAEGGGGPAEGGRGKGGGKGCKGVAAPRCVVAAAQVDNHQCACRRKLTRRWRRPVRVAVVLPAVMVGRLPARVPEPVACAAERSEAVEVAAVQCRFHLHQKLRICVNIPPEHTPLPRTTGTYVTGSI